MRNFITNHPLIASYLALALGCVAHLIGAPVWIIAVACIPGIVVFFIGYRRKALELQPIIEAMIQARLQSK